MSTTSSRRTNLPGFEVLTGRRRDESEMIDILNMGGIAVALWGVAAASLTALLTFAVAWAIIKGALIVTKLYRKWTERGGGS
jgi:hypothetical protein